MSAIPIWAILAAGGATLWVVVLRRSHWRAVREPGVKFRIEDAILAAALVFFHLYLIVIAPAEPSEISVSDLLNALVFVAGEPFLIVAILFVREMSPIAAFGLAPARPSRTAAFGVLCLLATYPLVELLAEIMASLAGDSARPDALVEFLRAPNPAAAKALGVFFAVVAAPLSEEVIFRGYLYGVMRQYCGRAASAVTISLLFAAVHTNLVNFPALFVLGLGFVIAYELSGSLIASITMHMLFNSATVVAVFYFPDLMK